jgi:hypothetical protein
VRECFGDIPIAPSGAALQRGRAVGFAHRHTSATVPPHDCFRRSGTGQRASASATFGSPGSAAVIAAADDRIRPNPSATPMSTRRQRRARLHRYPAGSPRPGAVLLSATDESQGGWAEHFGGCYRSGGRCRGLRSPPVSSVRRAGAISARFLPEFAQE